MTAGLESQVMCLQKARAYVEDQVRKEANANRGEVVLGGRIFDKPKLPKVVNNPASVQDHSRMAGNFCGQCLDIVDGGYTFFILSFLTNPKR